MSRANSSQPVSYHVGMHSSVLRLIRSNLRYVVAALSGAIVGVYALLFVAVFNIGWSADWMIPGWGYIHTFDFPSHLSLQYHAILLRAASLLIDYGLLFLGIPICALILLISLTDLSKKSAGLRFVTNTLWLMIAGSIFAAVLGFFAGAFGTTLESVSQNPSERWYDGFAAIGEFVVVGNLSGVIPVVALLVAGWYEGCLRSE